MTKLTPNNHNTIKHHKSRDTEQMPSDSKHDDHTPDAGSQAAQDLMNESFASSAKGKAGLTRIINAAGFSADGFAAAYKNEAAFRQVLWLNLVLIVILIFIPFAISIKMVLVFATFLSLIVELFNTGLEASIDHTSTDRHPLAKIGKDVGSAAQFLALTLLFILWSMALYSIWA